MEMGTQGKEVMSGIYQKKLVGQASCLSKVEATSRLRPITKKVIVIR